jgi:hypothetical protein
MLQEVSKSQMKQALRMVRNICQPKTGASTGKGFAVSFSILDARSLKHNAMSDTKR